MSCVSVNLPGNVGISASGIPADVPTAERSPNELSGYKPVLKKHDAVKNVSPQSRKTPETRSGCVRNFTPIQILNTSTQSSQSLLPCSGEKMGGRNLSTKTVVCSVRNTLALSKHNGYKQLFCKNKRKWPCADTILKGSAQLAPLDDFEKYQNGSSPRISSGANQETFYNSLFALIITKLRFKEMHRCAVPGHDGLPATEFPESELVKRASKR